ncbi:Protein of unknown function [Cotesia congregata]|uniref:HAT C-terminal dimerisation domain-containing protein n=1 Tax=Cotesia congregata TaxID=51543 RepID=A0A8J2H1V8_COTCN|nr:Protein of unknown function [Cotesia congregata]
MIGDIKTWTTITDKCRQAISTKEDEIARIGNHLKFRCLNDDCQAGEIKLDKIRIHIWIMHKGGQFKCPECKYTTGENGMKRHYRESFPQEKFLVGCSFEEAKTQFEEMMNKQVQLGSNFVGMYNMGVFETIKINGYSESPLDTLKMVKEDSTESNDTIASKTLAITCENNLTDHQPSSGSHDLWDFLDDAVQHNIQVADSDETDRLPIELRQFINRSTVDRKTNPNPIATWKSLESDYPHLSVVTRKYLSIVATSTPCERLFSHSGLIANQLRSRLSPNRLNMLFIVPFTLFY